ncbi:MAG: hypothetical protein ACKO2L_02040, partial [Planctomycetaceae bacterium]
DSIQPRDVNWQAALKISQLAWLQIVSPSQLRPPGTASCPNFTANGQPASGVALRPYVMIAANFSHGAIAGIFTSFTQALAPLVLAIFHVFSNADCHRL